MCLKSISSSLFPSISFNSFESKFYYPQHEFDKTTKPIFGQKLQLNLMRTHTSRLWVS